MKKLSHYVLAAFFVTMIFSSCGSTKIALQENAPIALISIVGNSYIPWVVEENSSSDEEEGDSEGIINGLINKVAGSNNPEVLTAVDRLDYAEESFRSIVTELTGAEVLDKEDVLNCETYKILPASFYNTLSSTVRATKFKDFSTLGAKKARYLMDSLGAKSLVILEFTFKKEKIDSGKYNQNCGGVVTMKVKVLNERGSEAINKTYVAKTLTTVRRYGSEYDKDAFVQLFYDAIDSVIRQFVVEYMGDGVSAVENIAEEKSVQGTKIALPARRASKSESTNESEASNVVDAKVEAAVTLVKKYKVSPEEAAKDMDAPLEKVLEALKEN